MAREGQPAFCSAPCLGSLPYKPCAAELMPCCAQGDLERLPPAGARRRLCLALCLHCCSAELVTYVGEPAAWSGLTCWQQVQHPLELLQVQQIIGARNATAMDLTAACSGFVLGVVTAAQFIRTGMCRNILVIGADALSRYVDWRDRCELSLLSVPAAERHLSRAISCTQGPAKPGETSAYYACPCC